MALKKNNYTPMPLFSDPPPKKRAPNQSLATGLVGQYQRLKQDHPDCLLALRVGEFYEFLFEDAKKAAELAGLALTSKGKWQGKPVPLAGVPVSSLPAHLAKWVKAGHKVALCQQQNASRGGLMARHVVRIFTPGTLVEEDLLDEEKINYCGNYLVALGPALPPSKNREACFPLAAMDVSTGAFHAKLVAVSDLAGELGWLQPAELLLPAAMKGLPENLAPALAGLALTWRPNGDFDAKTDVDTLETLLPGLLDKGARQQGALPPQSLGACAALALYMRFTQSPNAQQAWRQSLMPVMENVPAPIMQLDGATRRNLELVRSGEGRRATLLGVLDHCLSAAGKRLLAHRLVQPLADKQAIEARLDEVQFLLEREDERKKIRAILASLPDAPRALARLALGHARAQDLPDLAQAMRAMTALAALLAKSGGASLPSSLALLREKLAALPAELTQRLTRATGQKADETQLICSGFDAILDAKREEVAECLRNIEALQQEWRRRAGAVGLKLRRHGSFGHIIEIAAKEGQKLLGDKRAASFVLRQTLSNKMRLSHPRLTELDHALLEAEQGAQMREQAVLDQLAQAILAAKALLAAASSSAAQLDVAQALAQSASLYDYVRPELTQDGRFEIVGGRHPVVEQILAKREAKFQANDCNLDANGNTAPRLLFLTGPNMGGKSTYLRQNALILCMAQMGAFVPAKQARIGIADRLSTRIGAQDQLASGRSTFMVEMMETAAILRQASNKSFVLIDEIGRGTATHDGLALARAVAEYLHNVIQCRGSFSTHFHELTQLADFLSGAASAAMQVEEEKGKLRFLYQLAPGPGRRSLGLETAKLAGLPAPVLARASQLLSEMEKIPPTPLRPVP